MRTRAALAAALTMSAVLLLAALWLSGTLRDNLLDSTSDRTELAARKGAAELVADAPRTQLSRPQGGVDALYVLDADGRTVTRTAPDPTLRVAEFRKLRPPRGEDAATVERRGEGRGSVVSVARAEAPGGPYYVYAYTELADVEHAISTLGRTLSVAGPVLVLLSAAIGWMAASLTLRPVTAVRRALAAVTYRSLDRRVPLAPGGDEITALADTVNATLDRLEEAVGQQRRFVADASHELRNPIATLRAELEVAAMEARDPESAAAFERVHALALRLQRIAADLLLLARFDAKTPGPREPADLALLAAEEAARRHRAPVPVRVHTAGPAPVRGDEAQLERLLANLVDNALRYTATAVDIRVRTDPAAGLAILEVADDGPGIPEADHERVFERFTRLHPERDRASGGTGLGLPIAREIAQAHTGTLTLTPTPTGTLFTAQLPLTPDP